MTLAERIPHLTDAELASLHVNALRLSAGAGRRNREAADLLPALEAEVSARKLRRTGTNASKAGTGGRKGRAAS
jgi:hypothetical protein